MAVDAKGMPGEKMAAESAEALTVFSRAALQKTAYRLELPRAIYTIARGSSDAAANILSYEFMRHLQIPMTTLPPSIFSLGRGVRLKDAMVIVVSQSGASDDLVRSAQGAASSGATVVAITNQTHSPVEAAAQLTLPVDAGPEQAVPATKSVVGSIGSGLALLAELAPLTAPATAAAAKALSAAPTAHPDPDRIISALLRARHVYVIGRDTGYGAALEVALKLKECCALHAEPYSASEVLHGPLQLATNPLMVLILDTDDTSAAESLDQAERRFRTYGCDVHRIAPGDFGVAGLPRAAAAALLLAILYPIILQTAVVLGFDPDSPRTLSKVTRTT